jgi:hypothetical protein
MDVEVFLPCENKSYTIKGEFVDLLLCPYKMETLVTFSLKVRNDSMSMEFLKECVDANTEISITHESERLEEGPGAVLPPISSREETSS